MDKLPDDVRKSPSQDVENQPGASGQQEDYDVETVEKVYRYVPSYSRALDVWPNYAEMTDDVVLVLPASLTSVLFLVCLL